MAARRELPRARLTTCLKRLQTDHIDLVQHHEIIRFDDPNRIFADGGATRLYGRRRKLAKFAISDSPATKIRTFIFIC